MYWNIEKVKGLRDALARHKSEDFTTRELMAGCYHPSNDGQPDEYIPEELIDQVITEGG